jgi:hypothetical protein
MPAGEIVATAWFDDSQTANRVTSCELPSDIRAIAVI